MSTLGAKNGHFSWVGTPAHVFAPILRFGVSRVSLVSLVSPDLGNDLRLQLGCLIRFSLAFLAYVIIGQFGILSLLAQSEHGPTPRLTESEIADGWLSLFDGETLFGWHPMTDANWETRDGQIQVSEGTVGLLRTSAQFDDFELRLEVKAAPRTNSGIFFRTSPRPSDPNVDCIELNIASRTDSPFPTGSLVGRVAWDRDIELSEWTEIRLLAEGERIRVWVNEDLSCDYSDQAKPRLGRGFVGLQYNSGAVAFRHIRIRPLAVPPLLMDQQLSAWDQSESRASQFSVNETAGSAATELRIRGGSGQLETRQSFADFILSLQCRTGGAGMNSGIFFRCIPGEYMNGYESQIQNQFESDDRTRPIDCGTGGIFRRVNARRVNADDEAWFAKTIIACGANISVWVNGYQVTDWTDPRPADPNPRTGKRLGAGTIILQGHDPGTDVLLRQIRVRELAPRGR